ncbi:ankyrin repeat domain-containing protein [Streptomyces sp. YIM S03343]
MFWSAGHEAVEQEDLAKLRSLLDDGYDVEDDNGDGWTLLRHAIDVEIDGHIQSGRPLHVDVTAFLLARGADPLRRTNGILPADEADADGHWLAAELIRAWTTRPAARHGDPEGNPG